jgi:hypothetical protein
LDESVSSKEQTTGFKKSGNKELKKPTKKPKIKIKNPINPKNKT